MFPLLLDATKHLIEFIENDPVGVDIRDACSRYTCDAICSCLLGIEAHSFTCEQPEIFEHSKKMMQRLGEETLKMFPGKLTPPESDKFFSKLFIDSINYRVENKIERDDFLTHIIANRDKKTLSETDVIAQAWAIYMDSFETSAIGLLHIFYELAKNQTVQEKLRRIIADNLNENGNFGFEKLTEVEYLDQVFYEALRLNPPLTFNNKLCSEACELEGAKGHKYQMVPGTAALIPTYSVHRDPEYYPFPDSFQPERFDAEHGGVKAFRDKSILIPFGIAFFKNCFQKSPTG
jgi:cytochrome P450 family 6